MPAVRITLAAEGNTTETMKNRSKLLPDKRLHAPAPEILPEPDKNPAIVPASSAELLIPSIIPVFVTELRKVSEVGRKVPGTISILRL